MPNMPRSSGKFVEKSLLVMVASSLPRPSKQRNGRPSLEARAAEFTVGAARERLAATERHVTPAEGRVTYSIRDAGAPPRFRIPQTLGSPWMVSRGPYRLRFPRHRGVVPQSGRGFL